jgi:uncharacterized protein YbbC (DUF1343 family)
MVRTGIDVILDDPSSLKGRRIGLIANHTALTGRFTFIWDEFARAGLNLTRIFSPEHGLFGTEQDQVPVGAEPGVTVPVVSLYGSDEASLMPSPEHLADLDCLVYDIQDVGARYYTFVNSMIYCMRQVSGTGVAFVVLDRPNPLGGTVEGPLLREGFESFVGVMPVAVRHGMTAGELALFSRDHFGLDLDLSVVAMNGWSREYHFPETGLFWTPPSPNMPDYDTALVYPGMCLIEGMNISEGRGTTTPFRLVGAPWIDAAALAAALDRADVGGAVFVPHYFRPQFHKYSSQVCGGVRLQVTDPGAFRPFSRPWPW